MEPLAKIDAAAGVVDYARAVTKALNLSGAILIAIDADGRAQMFSCQVEPDLAIEILEHALETAREQEPEVIPKSTRSRRANGRSQ